VTRAELSGGMAVSAGALLVALLLSAVLAIGNPERTILLLHHQPLAAWLRGEQERALLTYPMWGYAGLLALFSERALHVLQLAGASLAAGCAWLVLAPRVGSPRLLAALLVLGAPWHALAASLWSPAPAAALSLLAVLLIGVGLERGSAWLCAAGGAVLGGAANFRSESLALAIALPLAAGLARWRGWPWGRPLHAAIAAACALATLLPWALHVHRATGAFAWTSSNGGMVALISLGQLPGNPWGIAHHDAYAAEWLRGHGVQADPLSPEGDRALRDGFRQAIAAHPLAYARKLGRNLRNAAIGGLYVGQIVVPPEQAAALDALRERWKARIGLNPNVRETEAHERNADATARLAPRTLLALAWQGAGVVLGALLVWLAAAGVVLARHALARDGVLALCALAIATQLAVMTALQYLPRHTTSLYPMLATFAAIAVSRLRRAPEPSRARRPASPRRSRAPSAGSCRAGRDRATESPSACA
jgi:hypothetical protein